MKELIKRIARFLVATKQEMKKIKWLTKKEMAKYSIATLSIMVFLGLYFLLADFLIGSMKVLVG